MKISLCIDNSLSLKILKDPKDPYNFSTILIALIFQTQTKLTQIISILVTFAADKENHIPFNPNFVKDFNETVKKYRILKRIIIKTNTKITIRYHSENTASHAAQDAFQQPQ